MRYLWITLMAIAASGCASIPLTSLPKLMSLNIETIDPDALELAVMVPDTVGIKPGSARIDIKMTNKDTGRELNTEQVIDMPVSAPDPVLQRKLKPGQAVHRFRLSETAVDALTAYREDALIMRADASDTTGSFSASIGFCRLKDKAFPATVPMVFYVRTKPGQSFFKLFKTQTMQTDGIAAQLNAPDADTCPPDPNSDGAIELRSMELEKG